MGNNKLKRRNKLLKNYLEEYSFILLDTIKHYQDRLLEKDNEINKIKQEKNNDN